MPLGLLAAWCADRTAAGAASGRVYCSTGPSEVRAQSGSIGLRSIVVVLVVPLVLDDRREGPICQDRSPGQTRKENEFEDDDEDDDESPLGCQRRHPARHKFGRICGVRAGQGRVLRSCRSTGASASACSSSLSDGCGSRTPDRARTRRSSRRARPAPPPDRF